MVQIDVKEAHKSISSKKNGLSDPHCKFTLRYGSQVLETFTSEVNKTLLIQSLTILSFSLFVETPISNSISRYLVS